MLERLSDRRGDRRLFASAEQLLEIGGRCGLRSPGPFGADDYGLVVAFKPDDERGLVSRLFL